MKTRGGLTTSNKRAMISNYSGFPIAKKFAENQRNAGLTLSYSSLAQKAQISPNDSQSLAITITQKIYCPITSPSKSPQRKTTAFLALKQAINSSIQNVIKAGKKIVNSIIFKSDRRQGKAKIQHQEKRYIREAQQ